MNYMTDRKRATGLGAAGAGTHHHWQMMGTSIALVVLVPLFVVTFAIGLGGTYEDVIAFFGRPVPAIITGLSLVVGIIHLKSEADEAIVDYMHGTAQKLALKFVAALSYTLIAAGLFALVKLAL
ncbi:succinate dehydrogenase, hydrophobic membrane anchor protein [Tritonibacter multivorans]|uniref:Succinate dehydrogenase hydrophobic membrane anchor subunit n=1 Tax=Tritonibacter multivorans TaxID=928856 RepID=A0A0P1G2A9_9RHOB|nr:succinate dehydrogenase, hydrophobic membrane anchor protein [Tritonibacter multivorans]MDA7419668.1 succinate dehydrogenase, hydrophobic membrane anchor protein [Tritonibacter multivorans]CUH75942.1 succinate dehydrogenase, hydrophobic membrane anchor protein [Tritonibacter multivorans]SFC58386.1 succinate dehydrogenase subunit D [Tritonibacter multivorans]